MTEQQLFDFGLFGNGGSLRSGGMKGLFGSDEVAFLKGGFMIKQIDAFDDGNDGRTECRIGTEGVAPCRLCGTSQSAVGDDFSIFRDEIRSLFDLLHLFDRNVIEIGHLADDVIVLLLFDKEITTAGNAMIQRNRPHRDGTIFHDNLMLFGVNGVKSDFERQILAEEIEYRTKPRLQIFRSVDEKIARSSQHSKRGNQSGKAETVIAVQMGNENMVEPAEFGVHLSHLELRSFATVNHVELIAQVYDLRSGEMSCCGQS